MQRGFFEEIEEKENRPSVFDRHTAAKVITVPPSLILNKS